jgi:hypothetical protein
MLLILSISVGIGGGQLGPQIGFGFAVAVGFGLAQLFAGLDCGDLASFVPLGAVVVDPPGAAQQQSQYQDRAGKEAFERAHAGTWS